MTTLVERLAALADDLPEVDDLMTEAAATITRLEGERDVAGKCIRDLTDNLLGATADMRTLAARALAAEAEVVRLREALKPLAECEIIESDTPLPDSDSARYVMTMGEIRAARAALQPDQGET